MKNVCSPDVGQVAGPTIRPGQSSNEKHKGSKQQAGGLIAGTPVLC